MMTLVSCMTTMALLGMLPLPVPPTKTTRKIGTTHDSKNSLQLKPITPMQNGPDRTGMRIGQDETGPSMTGPNGSPGQMGPSGGLGLTRPRPGPEREGLRLDLQRMGSCLGPGTAGPSLGLDTERHFSREVPPVRDTSCDALFREGLPWRCTSRENASPDKRWLVLEDVLASILSRMGRHRVVFENGHLAALEDGCRPTSILEDNLIDVLAPLLLGSSTKRSEQQVKMACNHKCNWTLCAECVLGLQKVANPSDCSPFVWVVCHNVIDLLCKKVSNPSNVYHHRADIAPLWQGCNSVVECCVH